jgi:hypothetical protein
LNQCEPSIGHDHQTIEVSANLIDLVTLWNDADLQDLKCHIELPPERTDMKDLYDAFTMKDIKLKEIPGNLAVGPNWDASMAREFMSWLQHEVVECAFPEGPHPNIVTKRWVFTEKDVCGLKKFKARLVARGFQDRTLGGDVDAPTAARDTFRMQLAFAANCQWPVVISDVPTSFLRADADRFKRIVYLKPTSRGMRNCPPEMMPKPGQLWRCETGLWIE